MAAAAALLGPLAWAQRRGMLHPEVARKAAHVGTGLLALAFPYLFDGWVPAALLVGGVMAFLGLTRIVPALRDTVGKALHGVGRDSLGEFWLLLSIVLLFALTGGGLLYVIPILVVTFADATAALVGVAYGRHRYDATEGQKSAEGSIAFFVVAFFSAHVPLLLLTQTGRAETLLISLVLGVLLLLFEGIAWRGLDNLFIPLSGFLLLRALLPLPASTLLVRLIVLAALGLLVLLWRRHTTLNAGALLGTVLVGYFLWTLGGWPWLVPPFIVFAGYRVLPPRIDLDRMRIHGFDVLMSVTSAGLAWLVLHALTDDARLYLPFTAAFAAHFAMIAVVRLRYARPAWPALAHVAIPVLEAAGLVLGPYVLIQGATPRALVEAGVALAGVVAATLLFHWLQYRAPGLPDPDLRWRREAACGALGSLAALAAFLG